MNWEGRTFLDENEDDITAKIDRTVHKAGMHLAGRIWGQRTRMFAATVGFLFHNSRQLPDCFHSPSYHIMPGSGY